MLKGGTGMTRNNWHPGVALVWLPLCALVTIVRPPALNHEISRQPAATDSAWPPLLLAAQETWDLEDALQTRFPLSGVNERSLDLKPTRADGQLAERLASWGNRTDARFGYALASGDFDGDGLVDLAVGAPEAAVESGAASGLVFVFKGATTGLRLWQTIDQQGVGMNEAGDQFGWALAVGDFDGDGNADLAIGAPGEGPGDDPPESGAVFVFRGSSRGLSPWPDEWHGLDQSGLGMNEAGDRFGFALAAGDFDHDGMADLAVGAPGEAPRGGDEIESGSVYLFRGSLSGPVPWQSLEQRAYQAGDRFGHALAAGDFDGDGIADLAVGAPRDGGILHFLHSGYVFVFRGSPSGFTDWNGPLWLGLGQSGLGRDEPGDRFGSALAAADFDRDGRTDLAVGIPSEAPGSDPQSGSVDIFHGSSTGLVAWRGLDQSGLGANEAKDLFGWSLAIGDFDGDHDLDLAVGAPGEAPQTSPRSGYVFVFQHSATGLTAWHGLDQSGLGVNEPGDQFGTSLASGDFDGDGRSDLAVGAPGESPATNPRSGYVFVFKGSSGGLTAWHGLGPTAGEVATGAEPATSSPAATALIDAYRQLAAQYGFSMDESEIRRGYRSLVAYNELSFTTPTPSGGTVRGSIELHDSNGVLSVWIAVPDRAWRVLPDPPRGEGEYAWYDLHTWHEFRQDAAGHWNEVKRPGIISSPYYPQDRVISARLRSGPFADFDEYDWWNNGLWGFDPPHWTPIALYRGDPELWGVSAHPWIGLYHDKINLRGPSTWGVYSPESGESLRDRAMEDWQPVTLRGIVLESHFPHGDAGADHTWYYQIDDRYFFSGGNTSGEVTSDRWPGKDWNIKVAVDPDLTYLLSDFALHSREWQNKMEAEIEHFALPSAYRPIPGEWVQIIGRWVTDNGHPIGDETYFRSEIHPPELIVSSHPTSTFETSARVVATGAWMNGDLSFVVYPPMRPSPYAQLEFAVAPEPLQRVNIDVSIGGVTIRGLLRLGANVVLEQTVQALDEGTLDSRYIQRLPSAPIDCVKYPADSPNHLICTIHDTMPAPSGPAPWLHERGFVYLQSSRGHQSTIRVWWEDAVPSVDVAGVVRTQLGQPAVGSHSYFRESGEPTWRSVPVADDGSYQIAGLSLNASYSIRPAGSKWDFRTVPVSPRLEPGRNVIDFEALEPTRETTTRDPFPPAFHRVHPRLGRPGLTEPGRSLEQRTEDEATNELINSLIAVTEPGSIGVTRNGFGLPNYGDIVISIAQLVRSDGTPVASLEESYHTLGPSSDQGLPGWVPPDWVPLIEWDGVPGLGVAGARVRATLWTGNYKVGFRQLDQVEAVSNAEGLLGLRLVAGTHSDAAVISLEVLENPGNPWFLPAFVLWERAFPPAASGDDLVRYQEYRLVARALPQEPLIGAYFLNGIEGQTSLLNETVLRRSLRGIAAQMHAARPQERSVQREGAQEIAMVRTNPVEIRGIEELLENRRETIMAYVLQRLAHERLIEAPPAPQGPQARPIRRAARPPQFKAAQPSPEPGMRGPDTLLSNAQLIDFATVGGRSLESERSIVHSADYLNFGITFDVGSDLEHGVVGVVTNGATSACVDVKSRMDYVLATGRSAKSLGSGVLPIRLHFDPPITAVSAEIQTSFDADRPMRLTVYQDSVLIGTVTAVGKPAGNCSLPGGPRAVGTLEVSAPPGGVITEARFDVQGGGRVFAIDNLRVYRLKGGAKRNQ
jgi:hypothetical protein